LSVIIYNRWATGMIANSIYQARGIENYEIYIELTEFGLKHIDDIVSTIFQVMWFFNELMKFKFLFTYTFYVIYAVNSM